MTKREWMKAAKSTRIVLQELEAEVYRCKTMADYFGRDTERGMEEATKEAAYDLALNYYKSQYSPLFDLTEA